MIKVTFKVEACQSMFTAVSFLVSFHAVSLKRTSPYH